MTDRDALIKELRELQFDLVEKYVRSNPEHLKTIERTINALRRPVEPVVTAEDAADRMARLRHQMPLKNLSDIIQNSYLELARAALNVSQPGVK